MKLEVCAANLASALAAERGGADRIELCSALPLGGLTPGPGLIEEVVGRLGIPVFALVRPREGGFVYSKEEVRQMVADVLFCKKAGCAGVVVGAMTGDGRLDEVVLRELFAAAAGMGIVCHRAFDFVKDPSAALEVLIEIGFSRVLTSGGAATAMEGKSLIFNLLKQSAGQIEVMPGSGIRPSNIRELAVATGARSFHFSATRMVGNVVAELPGLESGWLETDEEVVRAARLALAGL